jgi:preprotein translocase subunit SecB
MVDKVNSTGVSTEKKWNGHGESQPSQSTQTVEIVRLYSKEQSCKIPHGYQAFQVEGKPEVATEMNVNTQPVEQNTFEVTLHISVTSKIEQRTLYQVLVQQAVVVKTGITDQSQLSQLLSVYLPNMLYPYARKMVADSIFNAGFPPVFLPIVDFSSAYQQRKSEVPATT